MRLKENTLYLVADDRCLITGGETGLYRRDTRFLSRLEWRVGNEPPTVLSTHSPEPYRFSQHATEGRLGHTQRLELRRRGWLDGASYVETVRVRPFDDLAERATPWGAVMPDLHRLELRLDVDFHDLFEVRGLPPARRAVSVSELPDGLEFAYAGADGVDYRTRVRVEPMGSLHRDGPHEAGSAAHATFSPAEPPPPPEGGEAPVPPPTDEGPGTGRTIRWQLSPEALTDGQLELRLTVTPLKDGQPGGALEPDRLAEMYAAWRSGAPVAVGNRLVQRVFDQATNDLRALLFDVPEGVFPAAGIPWFVAPFGRDSLWVALMTLPWHPQIARGTLLYLAAHQGRKVDPRSLEAPGKILHEQRVGEASLTGRTPFATYYGTVDATPLWVCLLGDYLKWTGDLETVRAVRPALEAALEWLGGEDADPDRDGLIEYLPHKGGITNQVWKDSGDSVFFEDGSDLNAPIASVEVQGYAYRARRSAAAVLRALGDEGGAAEQDRQAEVLAAAFHAAFWLEAEGYYAHALDARKRPARVLTSNPGHCLWAGIVPHEAAPRLVRALFSEDMWSGWGVRTLAEGSARYNPVSYHNGSVWPHDNAILALGLGRYGFSSQVARLAGAQLEAAALSGDARLPELFAGFRREVIPGLPDSPPVPYPAACHPQAWDAAAPFAFLWAALGFSPGRAGSSAALPAGWGTLRVGATAGGRDFNALGEPPG